jgi:hypothetical protein
LVQQLPPAAFDRRQIGPEQGCLNGREERREHGRPRQSASASGRAVPMGSPPMKPSKPHETSSKSAPTIGLSIIY